MRETLVDMPLLAVSTWTAVALGALLVVGVVVLSVGLLRRRRHVWRDFARDHGLRFRLDPAPRVEGEVDGRSFRLEVLPRGSDAGVLGVEEIRMQLALRAVPAGLVLQRAHGVVGAARKAMEPDVIETGDPELDHEVLLRGDAARVRAWLQPAQRRAARRLVSASARSVGIADGAVFLEDRSMISDKERLEQQLAFLRGIAPQLDGGAPA